MDIYGQGDEECFTHGSPEMVCRGASRSSELGKLVMLLPSPAEQSPLLRAGGLWHTGAGRGGLRAERTS